MGVLLWVTRGFAFEGLSEAVHNNLIHVRMAAIIRPFMVTPVRTTKVAMKRCVQHTNNAI